MANQKLENAVFMQIRVEKETRDKFQKLCKSKAINASELIRQWIDKYVKEHEKA